MSFEQGLSVSAQTNDDVDVEYSVACIRVRKGTRVVESRDRNTY